MWYNKHCDGTIYNLSAYVCDWSLGAHKILHSILSLKLGVTCTLSGTRQSFCRVLIWHSAKKSCRDGGFAECQGQALGKGRLFAERRWLKHSAKVATVPSATGKTLDKHATFAECLACSTRQICDVCRVQWPVHSAKHVTRHVPRSSLCRVSWSLHSQSDWKQPFLFVFYIPSKQTEDIYNQHHIYIINSTDIQHNIYITNVTCLTIYHK